MIYCFEHFVLDSQSYTLHDDKGVVTIEAQTFDLIVYLIENNQRVVSRDELFDSLWASKVVSDASLSNRINNARKALGDDGRTQSLIKTIHGRGYQFVGIIDDSTAEVKPTIETDHVDPRKLNLSLVSGIAIGVFLLLMVWHVIFNKPQSVVSVVKRPIIAVLPIDVDPSNKNLVILSAAFSDYLTNRLSSTLEMTVLHPETVLTLQQEFDDIWATQRVTNAQYMIKTQVKASSLQDRAQLLVTLYQLQPDNEVSDVNLGTFDFDYPHTAQDLVALFQERRMIIKEVVGLIRPGIEVPFSRVETENIQAYQLVISAHHLQRQDSCPQIKRAEQLLQRALKLDPDFSYAWLQLYDNIHRQVWMCGEKASLLELALNAAYQVDKLTPNRYNSVIQGRSAILVETGRVVQGYQLAYAFYQDKNNQNDIDTNARLAYALRYAGFLNQAESYITKILRLEPQVFSSVPINWTPNTLLYRGNREQYIELLQNNKSLYHRYYLALAHVQQGNNEAARKILTNSLVSKSDDLFARFSRALLAVLNEQPMLARTIVSEIAQQLRVSGSKDGEMTYKLAQLFALSGDLENGLHYFSLSVDQQFFCVAYFLSDPTIMTLRATAEFKPIIERAIESHLAFAQQFGLEPEVSEY